MSSETTRTSLRRFGYVGETRWVWQQEQQQWKLVDASGFLLPVFAASKMLSPGEDVFLGWEEVVDYLVTAFTDEPGMASCYFDVRLPPSPGSSSGEILFEETIGWPELFVYSTATELLRTVNPGSPLPNDCYYINERLVPYLVGKLAETRAYSDVQPAGSTMDLQESRYKNRILVDKLESLQKALVKTCDDEQFYLTVRIPFEYAQLQSQNPLFL